MQIKLDRCVLCGSDNISVKYNLPVKNIDDSALNFYRASTNIFKQYGEIFKCNNCGMVFSNPQPELKDLQSTYVNIVDNEYAGESASRSINAHLCLSTIKRHKDSGKLLDVGCSTGFFLNSARNDFDVEGVELSKWAVDYAKKRFKLDVKSGDIFAAKYPDKTFDIVTLIDAIEHMQNPVETIAEVNRVLKDGGLLYMVTPNIKSISSLLLGKRWWGLRPAHLFYFSPKTLGAVLGGNGFKITNINSYGRIFTYGYWAGRMKNYSNLIYGSIKFMISKFGIENKFLYINTRDSMEVVAVKIKDQKDAAKK